MNKYIPIVQRDVIKTLSTVIYGYLRLSTVRISYVIWCCVCVEPIKPLLCPLLALSLTEERESVCVCVCV